MYVITIDADEEKNMLEHTYTSERVSLSFKVSWMSLIAHEDSMMREGVREEKREREKEEGEKELRSRSRPRVLPYFN